MCLDKGLSKGEGGGHLLCATGTAGDGTAPQHCLLPHWLLPVPQHEGGGWHELLVNGLWVHLLLLLGWSVDRAGAQAGGGSGGQ